MAMNFRKCLYFNDKLARQFSLNVHKEQRNISHYDCLGITPKASQSEVKTAYYKLSKQYHPDLNKGNVSAAGKFRDITTAYEVLGNVKARKLYDRSLSVRGIEDYSPTTEDVVQDNYEHASFYRGRNIPKEKQPLKKGSQTVNYNIDEWTRAHYSNRFTNLKNDKEKVKTYIKVKNSAKQDNSIRSQIIISIGFALIIFSYFSSFDFDVPSKKPSKESD